MHSLFRLAFVSWLVLAAAPASSQEVLEYQFSFGEEVVLGPGTNRVTLTVTNPSDKKIDCEIASLLDGTSPDPLLSRIRFEPVEGSANCIGGSCTAIISPPPRIALWTSVGPFAPGESKTCDLNIRVAIPFAAEIALDGSAGPVRVFPLVHAVPLMGIAGFLLLASCLAASVVLLKVKANA
jgi:hypothetical protein